MSKRELKLVSQGEHCSVFWTHTVEKELKRLGKDPNKRKEITRCENHMRKFAEDGRSYLNDQKFKNEGHFSVGYQGGGRVAIYAFKAYQLRIYGGYVHGDFVCTDVDPAKKQNKANRSLLARAAQRLGECQRAWDQER